MLVADEKNRLVALQDAMEEKEHDIREVLLAEARLERLQMGIVPPRQTPSISTDRRGSQIAHPLGPDGGFPIEFVSSPTTKFISRSRHVEGEGCQTACWSHGIHPHRQARPRMLDVREASRAARCDRVRIGSP